MAPRIWCCSPRTEPQMANCPAIARFSSAFVESRHSKPQHVCVFEPMNNLVIIHPPVKSKPHISAQRLSCGFRTPGHRLCPRGVLEPPCGRPCMHHSPMGPSQTLSGSRQAPAAGCQLELYNDALMFLFAKPFEKQWVVTELPLWTQCCAG